MGGLVPLILSLAFSTSLFIMGIEKAGRSKSRLIRFYLTKRLLAEVPFLCPFHHNR
jgi:hypothetical protein